MNTIACNQHIVCVILPEKDEDELTQEFLKRGIPVVSPGWSVDRVVAEFSGQARQAKELWEAEKTAKRKGKRRKRGTR